MVSDLRVLAAVVIAVVATPWQEPALQATAFEDGYSRPRAVVVSSEGLVYVALSTAGKVAVIELALSPEPRASSKSPRVRARVDVCSFPEALAALPDGKVLVSCRFDPDLVLIGEGLKTERIPAGPEHGHRGLAVDASGRFAYVASPALGGVKVVDLVERKALQTLATGVSPRTLRRVEHPTKGPLLLVSNFISHTVTVHAIAADGTFSPALQTIATHAGVADFALAEGKLWLLTHEDRAVDRSGSSVEGLDSVILTLPVGTETPFVDARRTSLNVTEREGEPVVKLEAIAVDSKTKRVAVAGSASDNVLVLPDSVRSVGTAPAALAFLPDGRLVVANRLSDTLTIGDEEISLGKSQRSTPAELGELLFYSRALVPNNVATGGKSIYACSACHEEGHVDGRLHPAKKNRFFSMTKTCRGIGTTAPYLSLGNLSTLPVFSDNIVSTHAQGADVAPGTFDRYPVTLRVREGAQWKKVTLSPDELRDALTAYMATIPPEPSPYVAPGAVALSEPARRGKSLFVARCTRCHQAVGNTVLENKLAAAELEARLLKGEVALAGNKRHDVGTPVLGEGGNNPPSLRGVWDAGPLFSDGSATTLEAALERTNPKAKRVHAPLGKGQKPALSPKDREDLAAFLRSL